MLRTIITLIAGGLITVILFTEYPDLNDKATVNMRGVFDSLQGWAAQN